MIKSIITVFTIICFLCCKPISIHNDSFIYITLNKNNNLFTQPFEIIESSFWDTKDVGGLDKLKINNDVEVQHLYDILENSNTKKYIQKPFLYPEYAITLKYQEKNDTLYIDENLELAYLVKNDFKFQIENDLLYNYFADKQFLTRHTLNLKEEN